MSYMPVYGYSGDHPVRFDSYLDSLPVRMVSPNPYPPWTFLDLGSVNCTPTVSAGTIRITADGLANTVASTIRVYMVYAGVLNITAEINTSMAFASSYVISSSSASSVVDTQYIVKATPPDSNPSSAVVGVPWYRYRLRFEIQGNKTGMTASDYVEITIT